MDDKIATAATLRAAKLRISDPSKWTKHTMARDVFGRATDATHADVMALFDRAIALAETA